MCLAFSSVQLLELQVPHAVAQPLAAALELGDRALFGTRYIGAVRRLVAVPRRSVHHFEHVLRVLLPICRHMEHPTHPELAAYQFGERRLHDAAFGGDAPSARGPAGPLRVPAMALLVMIGSGAALLYATPWVLKGLGQFNNYALAPVLLVVLVLIGVVADRRG